MHIAIDVREACTEQKAGKARWAFGFVQEILQRDCKVTLLTHTSPPEEWNSAAEVIRLPSGWRFHIAAARAIRNMQPDVFMSPTSYITPYLIGSAVPTAVVVHDVIAFRPEPHAVKPRIVEKLVLPRLLHIAPFVFCTSLSAASDLQQLFPSMDPSRIAVIGSGPMQKDPQQNTPDEKTILCIGTLCPRKNQLRLIQAYHALPEPLRSQYSLLLVGGRGWQDRSILELAEKTPGVQWKDYVPDDEYEQLLRTCTVLAHPSLYEGFGLQVLDAMQRGVPVLTSHRGSLQEVCGNAAVCVDPEDIQDISRGLMELLTQHDTREKLRIAGPVQAKQYTWSHTVDAFLEVMQKNPATLRS